VLHGRPDYPRLTHFTMVLTASPSHARLWPFGRDPGFMSSSLLCVGASILPNTCECLSD
jgi:hypothetical protein